MKMPSEEESKRLRESEEKYRKMFERANDGIFAISAETSRIVEVNPRAEKMTGYSSADLVGMHVHKLHPPEEHEAAERLFEEVVEKGCAVRTDLHFLRKDGSKMAIDVSASMISYGDCRIIQRICRDVTERRQLREEQEAQRMYYEFILDMMPVGLGVRRDVNAVPSVEFENKKMKEMFGHDMTCSWHERSDAVPVKATIDDTGVYAEERYYPNGRVYQFTLSYYRNLTGSWSELQLVRDVTERRRLEDRLKSAMEDLEHKVSQRTLELRQKQAQLVQSEKMAALGHLVAGVAHEINTPIGALKSNNDLAIRSLKKLKKALHDTVMPDVVRRHPELTKLLTGITDLNSVNKTAMERIVTIVQSLRNFARLDKAEQDQVDIHEGLESTLTLVHHELKNRVEIHRDYAELPKIHCFPNQLNQVFMNILVNSSQAIEDKGDIYIKTYQRDNQLVVEIRDTGKGISKENLKRIFDPGFTTKGAGIGTGLGLSIVYQIIEEHKGKIEVESEVGRGTVVRILLPIR